MAIWVSFGEGVEVGTEERRFLQHQGHRKSNSK